MTIENKLFHCYNCPTLVEIAETLGTFHPVVIGGLLLVPHVTLADYDKYSLLDEICEISGTDSELWFEHTNAPGYWVCESPHADTYNQTAL